MASWIRTATGLARKGVTIPDPPPTTAAAGYGKAYGKSYGKKSS